MERVELNLIFNIINIYMFIDLVRTENWLIRIHKEKFNYEFWYSDYSAFFIMDIKIGPTKDWVIDILNDKINVNKPNKYTPLIDLKDNLYELRWIFGNLIILYKKNNISLNLL